MPGAITGATIAAAILVAVGILGLIGKLRPNPFVGIRTPFTMESDENWYAAHRAGALWMIFGGVLALMSGVAFLPFVWVGKVSHNGDVALCIGIVAVIVISAVGAWAYGTHAAKHGSFLAGPVSKPPQS